MRHRLLTYLLLLPFLCLAQVQTKENCIRVSTFLNAAGTDSITDITYYDKLGREAGQVAVRGAPTGKDIGFESSTENITLPNNDEGGNEQFAYDASGNVTKNSNKGITRIEYNLLNLPQRICFDSGQEIRYTHDADGNKLRAQYLGLNYAIDYAVSPYPYFLLC